MKLTNSFTDFEEDVLAWKYELRDKLLDRATISKNNCWLWGGPIDDWGYGRITMMPAVNNRTVHFVSWMCFKQSHIENQLDHICEIKNCFNPNHLQDITLKMNVRKARGWTQNLEGVWFCKRGHEMVGWNIFSTNSGKYVRCRECMYLNQKKHRQL